MIAIPIPAALGATAVAVALSVVVSVTVTQHSDASACLAAQQQSAANETAQSLIDLFGGGKSKAPVKP